MALTPKLVGDLMLKRLGSSGSAEISKIVMMIPEALKETGRRIAADPSTRSLLTSDPHKAISNVGATGKVDLNEALVEHSLLREFVAHGNIYFLPSRLCRSLSGEPLRLIGGVERLYVGDRVRFTGGPLPPPIEADIDYWIQSFDPSTRAFVVSTDVGLLNPVALEEGGEGTLIVQETVGFPLQFTYAQVANMPRYLDDTFQYGYIESGTLQILPQTSTGRVAFACPTWPAKLEDLPDSRESDHIFLETLYGMLRGQQSE